MKEIPQIREINGIQTLFVNGEPFFILGGELHNSAAASLEYMDRNVWPNLQEMNMNTVVLPLYWEQIEHEEGKYSFDLMDGLIYKARENGMHLVFLWFGLWKNGISTYVPAWVKKASSGLNARFFRVRDGFGKPLDCISPFCEEAVQADAAAFSQLMQHLAQADPEHVVIAVQVENEMGVLGADRDFSPAAEQALPGRSHGLGKLVPLPFS